jgi:hypothetical protein
MTSRFRPLALDEAGGVEDLEREGRPRARVSSVRAFSGRGELAGSGTLDGVITPMARANGIPAEVSHPPFRVVT